MEAFKGSMRTLSYQLKQDDFYTMKPVDETCFELFKPFQYKRLDLPVFFHSVMELICLGHFYYVIINGCLVVFRIKKMYSNVSCIVYFAPISISNNIQDEQDLVVALLIAGFSVRLTMVEVRRLNINLEFLNAVADTFPNEFIYSSKELIGLAGKRYKKIRNRIHKFTKSDGVVVKGLGDGVHDFILSWAKKRGVNYNKQLKFLSSDAIQFVSCLSFYLNDEVYGFSAIEKVGEYYNYVIGVPNHDSFFDMVPALDYYSILLLTDGDTLVNAGSGSIRGLALQKRRMRPCNEESVFRVSPIGDRDNAYCLVHEFLGVK